MLDKRLIFIFYCAFLVTVLAVETIKKSTYDSHAAPENGTCYKRVPYDEAVIANLSQGLIKTESTTPPPGIQTWITIVDCCDGYRRDEYTENCEFYCEEGCFGGNCTGPNECTCEDGWHVERGECRPVCRQRCPRNAYCFSPDVCTCLFGFEEIDGVCQPICQHNCRNGDCVAPADCRCHHGYFLNETRHCEPICESGCQHGFCAAPGVCSCDKGYVNQLYDSESCVPQCPAECIKGECTTPNVCTCKPGYQQNDNGTCEAQCEETCPENGQCVATNQCGCNIGFILDIQRKTCIELPTNTQTSKNYQNHGVYPARNNEGGEGVIYVTNNPYDSDQTKKPQGNVGLQYQVTTRTPQKDFHGSYGDNQAPRTQRPSTQQGSYMTSTPYPISGLRGGISGSTTYRPPVNDPRYSSQGPFASFEPYPSHISNKGSSGIMYASRPQYNLQDSFALQSPQIHNITRIPSQLDEPRYTKGPYGSYDSQTQSLWGINQNLNPDVQHTSDNYPNQHGQYKLSQGINRPYNPYFPNNPRDQEGVKTVHKRPTYETRLPDSLHQSYNPYASKSPHEMQEVKTSYGRLPYNSQGVTSTHGLFAPNSPEIPRPTQEGSSYVSTNSHEPLGVKTAQRPPTDMYSQSSVLQNNPHSGVSFSYGIDHFNRAPQYDRSFNHPQLSPAHDRFIISDPYVQPGNRNIDGFIILDDQRVPRINQLQSICESPCINSHCIGLNLCMCEIGFIPDPRNPNGNICVPL